MNRRTLMHVKACLIPLFFGKHVKMFNKNSKRPAGTMFALSSPDPKYQCPYPLNVKFTRTMIRLHAQNVRLSLRLTILFVLLLLRYDSNIIHDAELAILTVSEFDEKSVSSLQFTVGGLMIKAQLCLMTIWWVVHLGMTKCHVPLLGYCDLELDL